MWKRKTLSLDYTITISRQLRQKQRNFAVQFSFTVFWIEASMQCYSGEKESKIFYCSYYCYIAITATPRLFVASLLCKTSAICIPPKCILISIAFNQKEINLIARRETERKEPSFTTQDNA